MCLLDGTRVLIRLAESSDEGLLKEMFESCSDWSLHHRFFGLFRTLSHSQCQELVNVDYDNAMSIVGIMNVNRRERMVALAYYGLEPTTNFAEAAFLVQDDYQGQGIGTCLLRHLMKIAKAHRIEGFTAEVLEDNRAMLRVFEKSGCEIHYSLEEGVYHLTLHFDSAEMKSI